MHLTADPAGAKPRRDHRSLARVSRHEVPMTRGSAPQAIHDPARASHGMHRKGEAGWAPRRGASFVARWSEGRSPDDPGKSDILLTPRPRQGSLAMVIARGTDALSGSDR